MGNKALTKARSGKKFTTKHRFGKELTAKEIDLLKQRSKLSEDEIQDLHTYFWSQYPTGKIERADFRKFFHEMKHVNDPNDILCEHIFAVHDRDHCGAIDFKEFVMAVSHEIPHDLDSHIEFTFAMADLSGDGQLTLSELAQLLSAALAMAGETDQVGDFNPTRLAKTVFDTLGLSTQTKITKKQFIHGCKHDPYLRDLLGGGY